MAEEDFIRKAARLSYRETRFIGTEEFVKETIAASVRFRKPRNKALFFDEIIKSICEDQEEHGNSCPKAPHCEAYKSFDELLYFLREEIDANSFIELQPPIPPSIPTSLTHLHPTVQQAAGSRFESAHYADAVEKACIALEKAVRDKASQPPDLGGADLMNRVFSKKAPILTVSADVGEREGYMFLFRGMWQALRNHHAHNDTDLPAPRALEWLSFISALFYKLDEI